MCSQGGGVAAVTKVETTPARRARWAVARHGLRCAHACATALTAASRLGGASLGVLPAGPQPSGNGMGGRRWPLCVRARAGGGAVPRTKSPTSGNGHGLRETQRRWRHHLPPLAVSSARRPRGCARTDPSASRRPRWSFDLASPRAAPDSRVVLFRGTSARAPAVPTLLTAPRRP